VLIDIPGGEKVGISVTGGVAVYPQDATESADLLRTADEALYRAKRHWRGEFIQGRTGTGTLTPPDS
jgi:GGDEF domain-containing protein